MHRTFSPATGMKTNDVALTRVPVVHSRRLINSLWVCAWILLSTPAFAQTDRAAGPESGATTDAPPVTLTYNNRPDYRVARERVLEAAVRPGDGGGPLPRSTRGVRIGQAGHDAHGRREPDRQRGRPRRLWHPAGRHRYIGRRDARAEGRGRRDAAPDRARRSGRAAHARPPVAERRRGAPGDADLRRPALASAPGTRPRGPETDAHRRSPVREVPRRQRDPRDPAARSACTTA